MHFDPNQTTYLFQLPTKQIFIYIKIILSLRPTPSFLAMSTVAPQTFVAVILFSMVNSTHFNFEFNIRRNLKLFKLTLCELNSNIQDTNSRQRLFYSCANTIFILFYSLFVGLGSLSTSYYCSINTNFGVYQIVWNC